MCIEDKLKMWQISFRCVSLSRLSKNSLLSTLPLESLGSLSNFLDSQPVESNRESSKIGEKNDNNYPTKL